VAKQATTTIPIVMAISGDAIATGLVSSLARPEANLTGSTFFFPQLNAKRLELLKEACTRSSRPAACSGIKWLRERDREIGKIESLLWRRLPRKHFPAVQRQAEEDGGR